MSESFPMSYKKSLHFLATLVILGFSHWAQASDFHSARTGALGGAGHAGPLLTDAIFLNPSFVSFLPQMAVSGHFALQPLNSTSNGYNVSIQDGHADSLFQAGIAYTHRADANVFTFGAARSFVKRMGFGLGSKYVIPVDPSRPSFADINVSFTGLALDWLQVSLTGDNLIQTGSGRALGFLREITLGTKVNVMGIVLLYADPHWTPGLEGTDALGFEGGIEFPILKDFYLRGGYFVNSVIPFMASRGQGFGTGAGWMGPRLSIDYSFERPLLPVAGLLHTFSLSVFF